MAHNMKIDPLANAGIGFAITNTQLVKFNDDPALVGQQWYGVVLMGNAILLRIDEQIFIGG